MVHVKKCRPRTIEDLKNTVDEFAAGVQEDQLREECATLEKELFSAFK